MLLKFSSFFCYHNKNEQLQSWFNFYLFQDPCVFHIVAASKPDPPYNCTILNQTSDSLEVQCFEGFDGGQPQYFLLEVFDQQTGTLQANTTSKFAIFNVSDLDSGRILRMMAYAVNSKGRSEGVLLEGFTLKAAEKQTGTGNAITLLIED